MNAIVTTGTSAMRTCVICGVSIEGRHKLAKTCSTVCSRARRIAACADWHARKREEKRAAAPHRQCAHCGAPVIGRGGAAKFCSNDCMNASTSARYKARRLAAKPEKTCKSCGSAIQNTARSNSLYCCRSCRDAEYRRMWREKIAVYRAVDPDRYYHHRKRENEKRSLQRAALALIREIETKGLEALL